MTVRLFTLKLNHYAYVNNKDTTWTIYTRTGVKSVSSVDNIFIAKNILKPETHPLLIKMYGPIANKKIQVPIFKLNEDPELKQILLDLLKSNMKYDEEKHVIYVVSSEEDSSLIGIIGLNHDDEG